MNEITSILLTFLREAWVALAGVVLAFALLAGLAQVLRTASAGVLGSSRWVGEALTALLSLLTLGLFAFLGIPKIVEALQSALPNGGGCGPISELGLFASQLIGGLAALRMLKATLTSILSTSLGAPASLASALTETAEAFFGMLLAAAAIPLAARFLGAC
ncbi:MAG: hypothetical protein HYZ25_15435 [Chloroflexi bacterium]|nr:hypothetical protein [Chloroflexota bacterium]